MKITVFTSNQPRHLSLINDLADIAQEVYAVIETTTVFPGEVEDFYKKSNVMQEYFKKVIEAEEKVFGKVGFTKNNVQSLVLKMGDLNLLNLEILAASLRSDYYIIFGSSYIKGALCNFLVENKAINIHMGISPYYRGSSCNFWALYDKNPEYVGATIHLLSQGLDSGDMLFHAFPDVKDADPFLLGMRAVKSAHKGLVRYLKDKHLNDYDPQKQDKSLEIRYSRNKEFNDLVAQDYLDHMPSKEFILQKIKQRNMGRFLRPFIDR